MTLDDFLTLDEMEQAEAVWSGKLAGTRYEEQFKILLCHIDQFYVEAWYDVTYNILRKFVPFDDKGTLAPYFGLNYN
jgi:hypothetical protein